MAFHLRVLGELGLCGPDHAELQSVLTQPKRLALLTYLAVASPRGWHRRDALVALLWPEQDAEHARAALRQLLYGLRQSLGEGALRTRGDEVALDRSAFDCDVWSFEDAAAQGRAEAAVGIYRGPFLAGFFLSDAPEFEEWVEAERQRLARRYAAMLERVAEEAAARDPLSAVTCWRRLAAHDPSSSRVVLRLMLALEAAGEAPAAIRYAEQHAALLRSELDADPDPEVAALAERLRRRSAEAGTSTPPGADPMAVRIQRAVRDRYTLERAIGTGGMATVWLAHDLKHGRRVAMKILRPELVASLGAERFLAEIRLTAGLQHPHILPLHDSGQADGFLYYVMPYVEGQSLASMLKREGRLRPKEAVRIACEVAEALEAAHRQRVIHRDIKPGNILISGGHAVVADFGIATALDEAGLGRLTGTGLSLGSPLYMSPEQLRGDRDLDGRTDLYSLGCMLYEMLAGAPPFEGSLEALLAGKLVDGFTPLGERVHGLPPDVCKAVERALARDRDHRFATAAELREALLAALPAEVSRAWAGRRRLAAVALLILLVGAAGAVVVRNRADSERRVWAARLLADAGRLADERKHTEALALALQVQEAFPDDTALARLLQRISFTVPIHTDPPGARVYARLEGGDSEWTLLGTTPLENARFAGYTFELAEAGVVYLEDDAQRLRFELAGYRTRELLSLAVLGVGWHSIAPMDPVVLDREDPALEGMVRITGFTSGSVEYADFYMDRYEVTNRRFQEFVDAGGYREPAYWTHPFVRNGETLSFEEAMALFVDQTGRPGPSTWRVGSYPEGRADHPVGGVSWYEAAAYARWAGKGLPSTLQWARGRVYARRESSVVMPRSNLVSQGPRPVGAQEAMNTFGIYDMVGNVREWCFNEAGEGLRATRGGAWPDPAFYAGWVIPKPAFDRDPTNGFRLLRAFDDERALETLRGPVRPAEQRDYTAETPVSDVEFGVFRRFYAYDPYPLRPAVEGVDTLEHWIREVVAFDVPYGERGGAVLYLPRSAVGPFQTVLYWGGAEILQMRSVDEEWMPAFDFMVRAGRAVAVPLLKGTRGRARPPASAGVSHGSSTWRDVTIERIKDLSATIDYLETREDIDVGKLGYYGFSFGGWMAPIAVAVEPRIRVAVTNVGGLFTSRFFPEADPFNYLPRVHAPFLMINGGYDVVFDYATQQVPMFERLGTPAADKRHFVSPAGHMVPWDDIIRETLAWLDKYLGVPAGR